MAKPFVFRVPNVQIIRGDGKNIILIWYVPLYHLYAGYSWLLPKTGGAANLKRTYSDSIVYQRLRLDQDFSCAYSQSHVLFRLKLLWGSCKETWGFYLSVTYTWYSKSVVFEHFCSTILLFLLNCLVNRRSIKLSFFVYYYTLNIQ